MAEINLSRSAHINYTVVIGDTFLPPAVSFTIDSVPESFTGATLLFKMRDKTDVVIKSLTQASGITINSNSLQYTIAATDTDDWVPGVYVYDVEKTVTATGVVVTIQHGFITALRDQAR